jgi:hypothetical protein
VEDAILDDQPLDPRHFARALEFPVRPSLGIALEQKARLRQRDFCKHDGAREKRAEVDAKGDALRTRHLRFAAPGRIGHDDRVHENPRLER